ncbi:MAG TPA: polyamine aminopropyltransferase [Nitrospirae bacterium]|nr:polyamine aminopropyltransferase [Nitrospirota bacterium]
MLSSRWFLEFTTDSEAALHSIEEVLYTAQTQFQRLEILRLGLYGKALILDGKMQSAQSDEFIYHESLVHPALITKGDPRRVLIAGGGEGATIREVLRYPSIESVIMVDLDREVVEACKDLLPEWHEGAFDDPRVKVVYDDARSYIEGIREPYDIIILDLPEPMEEGPAIMLYTEEFYRSVYEHLRPDGIMVTQATTIAPHNLNSYRIIFNTISQVFSVVRGYYTFVPSFYAPWGFVLASKGADPRGLMNDTLRKRISNISGELRYYNEEIHRGMFSLPGYLKRALEEEDRVNRDSSPISFY